MDLACITGKVTENMLGGIFALVVFSRVSTGFGKSDSLSFSLTLQLLVKLLGSAAEYSRSTALTF